MRRQILPGINNGTERVLTVVTDAFFIAHHPPGKSVEEYEIALTRARLVVHLGPADLKAIATSYTQKRLGTIICMLN